MFAGVPYSLDLSRLDDPEVLAGTGASLFPPSLQARTIHKVTSRLQHMTGSGWEAGLTLRAEESSPARGAVAGPILGAAARPVVAAACMEAGRAPEPRWAGCGGWEGGMQREKGRAERSRREGRGGEYTSEPGYLDGPRGASLGLRGLDTLFSESLSSPLGLIPWDCYETQILCPLS